MAQDMTMDVLTRGQRLLLGVVGILAGLVICVLGSSASEDTDSAWPGFLIVLLGLPLMLGGVWLAFYVTKAERARRNRVQPSMVNAQTGAGWYPDPDSPSMRFWDGEAWTDQRAPLPQRQSSNLSAWTIARGVALGIIIVIVLGYLFADSNCTGYGC